MTDWSDMLAYAGRLRAAGEPLVADGVERIHNTVLDEARRDAAVVTAVHVAREWAIEQHGNRYGIDMLVVRYMRGWLIRNGADTTSASRRGAVEDRLVEAVWALAELPDADPLQLVDDTWRGTSDEARDMLQAQYERDLTDALNRITWKD